MKEHDVVRVVHDIPEYGLVAGDRGTIVWVSSNHYMVEFLDNQIHTLGPEDITTHI